MTLRRCRSVQSGNASLRLNNPTRRSRGHSQYASAANTAQIPRASWCGSTPRVLRIEFASRYCKRWVHVTGLGVGGGSAGGRVGGGFSATSSFIGRSYSPVHAICARVFLKMNSVRAQRQVLQEKNQSLIFEFSLLVFHRHARSQMLHHQK